MTSNSRDQDEASQRIGGNAYEAQTARDHARQHNGDNYNNYTYQYTTPQLRSDETLRQEERSQVLLKAAVEGQTPRVKYLVHQLRADIDCHDENGFTPLHHAALSGFEDVVEELLEAGADVNAQSPDYGSALHLACAKGRKRVVEMLLAYRANRSSETGGEETVTPLHIAAEKAFGGIVEDLVVDHADTNARDGRGATALESAEAAISGAYSQSLMEVCLFLQTVRSAKRTNPRTSNYSYSRNVDNFAKNQKIGQPNLQPTTPTSLKGRYDERAAGHLAASQGSANSSSAAAFNHMLNQYNELQQQTMAENMEMQKAQAFWNPLESMSKWDATS